MKREPLKEYMCKYWKLSSWTLGLSEPICAIKEMHKVQVLQRGCYGSECMHNVDGTENRRLPSYRKCMVECPFESAKDGKCRCMTEDGGSTFCQYGEKKIETSVSCHRDYYDPLVCRFYEPLTRRQALVLVLEYVDGVQYNHATKTHRGKFDFQKWLRDMLRDLGAPKEIYERPNLGGKTKEEYEKLKPQYDERREKFMSWYVAEMEKLEERS